MATVYFNINYEFDHDTVLRRIDEAVQSGTLGYVCVADGVILNLVDRIPDYSKVVAGAMFSICDSAYTPLYLRWLYGLRLTNYTGSELFADIVAMKRYRMMFLGAKRDILDALRLKLAAIDPRIADMRFVELPFLSVDEFDYEAIARSVEADRPDIIWVSLGAPKQEIFMSRLQPHLHRGVMIAVGAAFKFHSGKGERRAPQWMLDHRLEFLFRIWQSPRKQLNRCAWIVRTLPGLLWREWRSKKRVRSSSGGQTT